MHKMTANIMALQMSVFKIKLTEHSLYQPLQVRLLADSISS